jgi:hypothetical protein
LSSTRCAEGELPSGVLSISFISTKYFEIFGPKVTYLHHLSVQAPNFKLPVLNDPIITNHGKT